MVVNQPLCVLHSSSFEPRSGSRNKDLGQPFNYKPATLQEFNELEQLLNQNKGDHEDVLTGLGSRTVVHYRSVAWGDTVPRMPSTLTSNHTFQQCLHQPW